MSVSFLSLHPLRLSMQQNDRQPPFSCFHFRCPNGNLRWGSSSSDTSNIILFKFRVGEFYVFYSWAFVENKNKERNSWATEFHEAKTRVQFSFKFYLLQSVFKLFYRFNWVLKYTIKGFFYLFFFINIPHWLMLSLDVFRHEVNRNYIFVFQKKKKKERWERETERDYIYFFYKKKKVKEKRETMIEFVAKF